VLNSHTKKDIEKISMDILKSSRSLDVFPTPIDQIVKYSDLIVAGGIDVKSIQNRFKDFFLPEALISGLSKIRGFLDRSEKLIYLDLTQNNGRQGFVKLHETGHNVLPWQKLILQFVDDDNTLDATTKDEFEAETNYFASATLFQNDRFNRESKKYELGIPGALQLAKHFGASGHAALRRYVEINDARCMLFVIEGLSPKGIILNGKLRNTFYSSAFLNEFGKITLPNNFDFKWSFMQDYCFGKRMKLDGSIDLIVNGEMIEFCYHFFNNSFNVFVLIFPKGENKKTKTKIIIR
jgi:hypothetical protein